MRQFMGLMLLGALCGFFAGQLCSCRAGVAKKKHPFSDADRPYKLQLNAGESTTFSDEAGGDEFVSASSPASTVSVRLEPASLGELKYGRGSVTLSTAPGKAARGKIHVTRHYRLYEDYTQVIELEVLLPDSP